MYLVLVLLSLLLDWELEVCDSVLCFEILVGF